MNRIKPIAGNDITVHQFLTYVVNVKEHTGFGFHLTALLNLHAVPRNLHVRFPL